MGNEAWPAVPHLTTALTGPLRELESCFLREQADIEQWFRGRWAETPAPFYCSVDLRNSGFKLAPVDTNLFPGGFNNLNPAFQPLAIQATQAAVEHICPQARGMLLIPESHTRNIHYLENLAALADILTKAGMNLRVGSLMEEVTVRRTLPLPSGRAVTLEPIERQGRRLRVGEFDPCTVLLNNDLSGGCPPILEDLEQPVIPPLELGWWKRLKSNHFEHYRQVAGAFADFVDIDSWFINPAFRRCGKIDFLKREGEECLAQNVAEVLAETAAKYREHGINQEPFVIVKSDAGTYGMAILTVKSPDDVRDLNRKLRTKMAHGKEGRAVSEVMVQEGVHTFETWGANGAVAEPVVYMIDHYVVGGFYRVHTRRRTDENLNAPGMHFEPLAFADGNEARGAVQGCTVRAFADGNEARGAVQGCTVRAFEQSCGYPDPASAPDAGPNRFYAYGVIARLALLAAARELEEATSLKLKAAS
jgi:glutamate--cysteine ligase